MATRDGFVIALNLLENRTIYDSIKAEIESLAKSEDDISNKAIKVERSLPSAPGFMTFALFSGGTIVK